MQGQGPARGALTTPPGPATASVLVTHSTHRDRREENPGTPDIGREEEEQPPGELVQEQGKEETRGNYSGEVLERLRKKLGEEKNKEDRGIIKLRKKTREMERYLGEGAGGVYPATYMEILVWDKGYRREREGVVLGLERAIDLIELAEEEQGQQVPPPQSSPHPGHPASGGTPQNCQNTEDDEELFAGGEEEVTT